MAKLTPEFKTQVKEVFNGLNGMNVVDFKEALSGVSNEMVLSNVFLDFMKFIYLKDIRPKTEKMKLDPEDILIVNAQVDPTVGGMVEAYGKYLDMIAEVTQHKKIMAVTNQDIEVLNLPVKEIEALGFTHNSKLADAKVEAKRIMEETGRKIINEASTNKSGIVGADQVITPGKYKDTTIVSTNNLMEGL